MKNKPDLPLARFWKLAQSSVCLVALGLAFPALADYLGPSRTVTTYAWERTRLTWAAIGVSLAVAVGGW